MNIILIGFKHCGKTTIGKRLAKEIGVEFFDLDREIQEHYSITAASTLTVREIVRAKGEDFFRNLENERLKEFITRKRPFVLAVGGGTPCFLGNDKLIKKLGLIVYITVKPNVLLERILKRGIPAFFPDPGNPKKSLNILLKKRIPSYEKLADLTIDNSEGEIDSIVKSLVKMLREKTRQKLFDVE